MKKVADGNPQSRNRYWRIVLKGQPGHDLFKDQSLMKHASPSSQSGLGGESFVPELEPRRNTELSMLGVAANKIKKTNKHRLLGPTVISKYNYNKIDFIIGLTLVNLHDMWVPTKKF